MTANDVPTQVSITLLYKDRIWFNSNAETTLKKGQIVYYGQTGTHKLGDGVTQLKNLQFLPKIATSVTNTTIAFNDAHRILVDVVAPANINKYDPVDNDGIISNSNSITRRGKGLGLAYEGINSGFAGKIITFGEIENLAWSWVTGDIIYLNGTSLSTTPPNSGYIQKIGVAKTQTVVEVNLGTVILI